MTIAVPAVLPTSNEDLREKLSRLVALPSVERVQIDVVDGKFATPACWPYTAPQELQDMLDRGELLPHPERVVYEIDLMCVDAERAAQEWLALGATRLTFHAESVADVPKHLAYVKERYGSGANFAAGLISFGIALDVTSDLSLIEPCLEEVDYVQFMGIATIGRQGQPFDERVLEQVRAFHTKYPNVVMQVDGGVTLENAKKLLALGVINVIVGSALERAASLSSALQAFEDLKPSFGV